MTRICLIGAGPSGMSMLYNLAKMKEQGKHIPDVVCYEKQSDCGGLWNFDWRTGVDEHGEPIHGSMYHHLWSNNPKECLELPDYTFDRHFGKAIPSFLPREVILDYLSGRWKTVNATKFVRLNTIVKNVVYNSDKDNFTVWARDQVEDKDLPLEQFSHIVVATGHFSVPNTPYFKGVETFPGRVLHSHDFRDAREFKGKQLLVIGSSYSAEDILLQCVKFGAKSIVCSSRSGPMGFKWPAQIQERPLLEKIEGQTVFFKDGTSTEVDAIIYCTGYKHTFSFLPDNLRLQTENRFYPPNLYKGIVWIKTGNNKLMYIGMQNQFYSMTMFDVQSFWACRVILGEKTLPEKDTMEADITRWTQKLERVTSIAQAMDFQTKYVMDLCRDSGYQYNLDVKDILNDWDQKKRESIITYRDNVFKSKFTGTVSCKPPKPFMAAFEDSLDSFCKLNLH
ncbi:hypothetical protein CHS0354_008102 [Potamilus streckersoni]|uniref:Flavin-containing monooxygenase n=1 Tax=Potamilus streckersoni TaxID=2493646 RepID=A0AAE0T002_9BIVA|nr:hypothetical protein CHS0354_008102 [Potamilus streckersoni]